MRYLALEDEEKEIIPVGPHVAPDLAEVGSEGGPATLVGSTEYRWRPARSRSEGRKDIKKPSVERMLNAAFPMEIDEDDL